ncbi:MAG: NUDIX hydrolase [Porticoccaceae bacterium]|jgi:8-oxo-dGTP pyrophosphatase MutT (NUDIX family)|nr:NUDIX hydrolase [Porticoccaceae bacterium]
MPNKIHLTVATVVEKDSQFLMVKETKAGVQVINQPAGHVEVGEDVLQAALRETMEETGWEVSITGFLGFSTHLAKTTGVTYYRLSFVAQPIRFDTQAIIDPDIDMAVWMPVEEIRAQKDRLRSDMVLGCIEDYLANRIFPLDIFRNRL